MGIVDTCSPEELDIYCDSTRGNADRFAARLEAEVLPKDEE